MMAMNGQFPGGSGVGGFEGGGMDDDAVLQQALAASLVPQAQPVEDEEEFIRQQMAQFALLEQQQGEWETFPTD